MEERAASTAPQRADPGSNELYDQLSSSLASRKDLAQSDNVFKCPVCAIPLKNKRSVSRHVKKAHSGLPKAIGKAREAQELEPDIKKKKVAPESVPRKGGPTMVIYGFVEVYREFCGRTDARVHPLYQELMRLHMRNVGQHVDYSAEHPVRASAGQVEKERRPAENTSSTDEKRCDTAFAEYLDDAARSVNKEYYKKLLMFILMYRDSILTSTKYQELRLGIVDAAAQFSSHSLSGQRNETELVPELANEFVAAYSRSGSEVFDLIEAVAIIADLCCWMSHKGYTTSRLTIRKL